MTIPNRLSYALPSLRRNFFSGILRYYKQFLTVLLAMITLLISYDGRGQSTTAAVDLTDCYGSCTSNDFSIIGSFVSTDPAGQQVLTAADCISPDQTLQVYINITFRNTTQSKRNGIFLSATINGVYVFYCFDQEFAAGQTTTFTIPTPFDWTCGTNLTLVNTFVAWGTASEEVCTLTCTQVTGSKCRDVGDFIVNTPLIPDFDYLGSCPENNTIQLISFTNATTGGYNQYTYLWEFGDGTTSTLEDPTHLYAAAGEYDVKLTITDTRYALDADGLPTSTVISTEI